MRKHDLKKAFASGGSKDDLDELPENGPYGSKDSMDAQYRYYSYGMKRSDGPIIKPL